MRFVIHVAVVIISFMLMTTVVLVSFLSNMTNSFKTAEAAENQAVSFDVTDEPGRWFKNTRGPIAGTQSLAIINPGTRVDFNVTSNTVHTITSLIFPTGAVGMPFDQPDPAKGSKSISLQDPGLYVFFCKVHPYMFVLLDSS